MKKDLKDEKLLDEQLADVQGGAFMIASIMNVVCLHTGCNWAFGGPDAEAMAAKQEHTNATGHNQFMITGTCEDY